MEKGIVMVVDLLQAPNGFGPSDKGDASVGHDDHTAQGAAASWQGQRAQHGHTPCDPSAWPEQVRATDMACMKDLPETW